MSDNKYLDEYRKRSNQDLRNARRALSGQDCPIAKERREAVAQVAKEREVNLDQQAPTENHQSHKTLDQLTAEKYLSKKRNAEDRGIGFELTLGQMRKLMVRKRCPYIGVEMLDDCEQWNPSKRTIERIDSSRGYTNENTVACSLAANSLKNAVFEHPTSPCRMTEAQFRKFAKAIDGGLK